MTVDCVTYNGEADLLEIRLNVLDAYVDEFIIVEARTTFTNREKPLYYERDKKRFEKWWPKIKYFIIEEDYTSEEIALAERSSNTRGAVHWKHEFLQKERIKQALTHLRDTDTVFVGDVDEIWNPEAVYYTDIPMKLRLWVYAYYLNNRSSEIFHGPIRSRYLHIRFTILNHLRTSALKNMSQSGWHFTNMGGIMEVRRKLNDSYTAESYNTPSVQMNLESRFGRMDYLGRNFVFWRDESEWPQYLKDNRAKYAKLLA